MCTSASCIFGANPFGEAEEVVCGSLVARFSSSQFFFFSFFGAGKSNSNSNKVSTAIYQEIEWMAVAQSIRASNQPSIQLKCVRQAQSCACVCTIFASMCVTQHQSINFWVPKCTFSVVGHTLSAAIKLAVASERWMRIACSGMCVCSRLLMRSNCISALHQRAYSKVVGALPLHCCRSGANSTEANS